MTQNISFKIWKPSLGHAYIGENLHKCNCYTYLSITASKKRKQVTIEDTQAEKVQKRYCVWNYSSDFRSFCVNKTRRLKLTQNSEIRYLWGVSLETGPERVVVVKEFLARRPPRVSTLLTHHGALWRPRLYLLKWDQKFGPKTKPQAFAVVK